MIIKCIFLEQIITILYFNLVRASDQVDQDDNVSSDESGSDQESMEVKYIPFTTCANN